MLTHCGLGSPYGDLYLGHHWFRQSLIAWQQLVITWIHIDLSSKSVLWYLPGSNNTRSIDDINLYNKFENSTSRITPISPRDPWLIGNYYFYKFNCEALMMGTNPYMHIYFLINQLHEHMLTNMTHKHENTSKRSIEQHIYHKGNTGHKSVNTWKHIFSMHVHVSINIWM